MDITETWAYRDRSPSKSPLIPAEIVQFGPPKSQKVRVRWKVGEYLVLYTWLPKIRLPVLWSEAEAWLRDERLFNAAHGVLGRRRQIEHKAASMAVPVHPCPTES